MIGAIGAGLARADGTYFVTMTIRGGESMAEMLTPAQYAAVRSNQDLVLYGPNGSKVSMGKLLRAAPDAGDMSVTEPPATLTVTFVPAPPRPEAVQGTRVNVTA